MRNLSIKRGQDLFPHLTPIEKHICLLETVQGKRISSLMYQKLLKIYYNETISTRSIQREQPSDSFWTKLCNAYRIQKEGTN